jgi:tetratricopeptide (TPR) repeat protein
MAALPPRSAQADKDGKAKARELLQSGDRRFQRGENLQARGKIEEAFAEYERALVDYQAAFEAYSDPQIFFPIALAEQRLGRFVESLGHYRQLLEEGKGLSGELRSRVRRAIIDVKRNLAAVLLEVKPEGAAILIDGREVARSPMSQPAFVEPGQHTYAVTLEGHTPVEGKMDLLPGKEMRRRIDLERMPVVVGGQTGGTTDTTPVDTGTQPPSRVPLYLGLGVTGALALGGATTGILALSRHSKFRDESIDMGEREDARHSGKKLAGVTDILLGGAVVGALVTTYYYYAVYLPKARAASGVGEDDEEYEEYEEYEEEAARLQVTPVIGDGVAGVAAWGRF